MSRVRRAVFALLLCLAVLAAGATGKAMWQQHRREQACAHLKGLRGTNAHSFCMLTGRP